MTKTARTRLLLVVFSCLALAGVGLVHRARVHREFVEQSWAATEAQLAQLERELDARDGSRPALWGETTDERAAPYYDVVFELVADFDRDRVRELRGARSNEERQERARLLEQAAPLFDALHRGAHARDASRPVDWSLGFEVPIRSLMSARVVQHLAEGYAARAFEDGRPLAGVNVLLNAMQFAGDLSESPILIESMIGLGLLVPELLQEGVAEGALARLPADAAARLATGLDVLDQRLGWETTSLEPEMLLSVRGMQRLLLGDEAQPESVPEDLRGDLGHVKALWTDHVRNLRQLQSDVAAAYGPDPAATLARLDELVERSAASDNRVTEVCGPSLDAMLRARFFSLGRFRLLTFAIRGEQEPRDPWMRSLLRIEQRESDQRLTLAGEFFGGLELIRATPDGAVAGSDDVAR